MFLHRQECHPHAISAGKRQFETQLAALAKIELVRNLEKNAGAVSGLGIASAGATVRQAEQHLDSLADDFMAFVATDVGHESNPASVVLLRRMVQTLGGRRTTRFFSTRRHGHVCSISIVTAHLAAFGSVVLEWGLSRKGCGGGAHSAQEHTCLSSYLLPDEQ